MAFQSNLYDQSYNHTIIILKLCLLFWFLRLLNILPTEYQQNTIFNRTEQDDVKT